MAPVNLLKTLVQLELKNELLRAGVAFIEALHDIQQTGRQESVCTGQLPQENCWKLRLHTTGGKSNIYSTQHNSRTALLLLSIVDQIPCPCHAMSFM
jgi:hypothetical protein